MSLDFSKRELIVPTVTSMQGCYEWLMSNLTENQRGEMLKAKPQDLGLLSRDFALENILIGNDHFEVKTLLKKKVFDRVELLLNGGKKVGKYADLFIDSNNEPTEEKKTFFMIYMLCVAFSEAWNEYCDD